MRAAIVDVDFFHAQHLVQSICHPAGVSPTLHLCQKPPPNSGAVAGLVAFCLAQYDIVAVPLKLCKEIPLHRNPSASRLICPKGCGLIRAGNTIYIDQPPYSENVVRWLVWEVTHEQVGTFAKWQRRGR